MIDTIDYAPDGPCRVETRTVDAAADPTKATIAFKEWGNDARAASDF